MLVSGIPVSPLQATCAGTEDQTATSTVLEQRSRGAELEQRPTGVGPIGLQRRSALKLLAVKGVDM